MTQSRKGSGGRAQAGNGRARPAQNPKDLQPAPTGANKGSPAAPVMKRLRPSALSRQSVCGR